MRFIVEKMNEEMAIEILKWTYEMPYDFYNNELTNSAVQEMLDGSYYAIVTSNELVGFFCIGENATVPIGNQFGVYIDNFVDMGLGMNPNLVGKGNGYEFCSFIMEFIEEKYKSTPIRLTVAKFNLRAIHLYEKLGFEKENDFSTNSTEFITMVKKL